MENPKESKGKHAKKGSAEQVVSLQYCERFVIDNHIFLQ
jgi:hypothetical protein